MQRSTICRQGQIFGRNPLAGQTHLLRAWLNRRRHSPMARVRCDALSSSRFAGKTTGFHSITPANPTDLFLFVAFLSKSYFSNEGLVLFVQLSVLELRIFRCRNVTIQLPEKASSLFLSTP
jgi:hypothetical protein